ncbi:MAG: transcription antitermination factor NusB [Clostridia bacterium]|nr:transcription antitermination factor NusB [Clostridia bacterium]
MTRREQREAVLELLFETEFKKDESAEDIFALAVQNREFSVEAGSYIKDVYFDLLDKLEVIDEMIGKCSEGWKTARLSRLSRSVLRLCVYELLYRDDIPTNVSINEAVELSKKFDDPKAKSFVNGVLNGVKNLIEKQGKPSSDKGEENGDHA